MGDTYPHKLSWTRWVLCAVFCNQGAVAQHDNLTQNWVFSDLLIHSQALKGGENKELILCPRSHIVTNTKGEKFRVNLPQQA